MTDRLRLAPPTRLLVLTGAGASAESGISTFRDAGGLWEQHRLEDLATPEAFERNPALVWRFYSRRRAAAKACLPNAGHLALAAIEERLGERFLLVTQNVDALHLRAGSQRVIELHGNLFKTRCSRCGREPFADEQLYEEALPECDRCRKAGRSALLRPHIVWFGEPLFPGNLEAIEAFLAQGPGAGLVFLAVGTSGVVYPAAGLVSVAKAHGAQTWLVNAEPPDNRSAFDRFVQGKSAEVLPPLLGL